MIESAERRSLEAALALAELRAMADVIGETISRQHTVLSEVAESLGVAAESVSRAEADLLRARARAAYLLEGGVPAHFDCLYSIVLRRAG